MEKSNELDSPESASAFDDNLSFIDDGKDNSDGDGNDNGDGDTGKGTSATSHWQYPHKTAQGREGKEMWRAFSSETRQ